ncbi:hypothetical protein Vadar_006724 [Vaccinium darrowii]|uniref:Uncharacterized protein n=1 Tax=Vaccinium darrowii TaxID=229202 RepID=A0ACB7YD47_9ERIC|nr:hypothetical protein Vadar_006724 [Vaccinium darrowii]
MPQLQTSIAGFREQDPVATPENVLTTNTKKLQSAITKRRNRREYMGLLPIGMASNQGTEPSGGTGEPIAFSETTEIDTSESLDHETTEPSTVKGKHSSPNHQSSFSPQRIGSSSSFRDSSTFPQVRSEDSDGFFSTETYSGVLHSCTHPIRLDPNTGSDMRQPSLDASQITKFPNSDASCAFMYPNEKMQRTISRANAIGAFEKLDHERHPSPNRRFIVGLGSSRRSLSFKEGSNVSQGSTYNSLKSGRSTSEVSDSLDNSSRNKASTTTRATLFEPTRISMPKFLINDNIDPRITLANNTSLMSGIFKLMPLKERGKMQTVCKHFCVIIEDTMPRLYGEYRYSNLASIEAKARMVHSQRIKKMKEAKEREEMKGQVALLVSSVLKDSEKV